jgi:hypothetical protein
MRPKQTVEACHRLLSIKLGRDNRHRVLRSATKRCPPDRFGIETVMMRPPAPDGSMSVERIDQHAIDIKEHRLHLTTMHHVINTDR